MGTSTEQARQAVAATRQRVEVAADRLEARLRYDLDPRQRLRRDGAKLAAGLAVVVLVGAVYVVRSRRRRGESPADQDWIAAMPEHWRQNLQELLAEAAASGHLEVRSSRASRSGGQSLASKLARIAWALLRNKTGFAAGGRAHVRARGLDAGRRPRTARAQRREIEVAVAVEVVLVREEAVGRGDVSP